MQLNIFFFFRAPEMTGTIHIMLELLAEAGVKNVTSQGLTSRHRYVAIISQVSLR
jgi:hypothetical protein